AERAPIGSMASPDRTSRSRIDDHDALLSAQARAPGLDINRSRQHSLRTCRSVAEILGTRDYRVGCRKASVSACIPLSVRRTTKSAPSDPSPMTIQLLSPWPEAFARA